eukprot:gene8722-670_t
MTTLCDYCHRNISFEKVISCEHCTIPKYCSEHCWVEHWNIHVFQCPMVEKPILFDQNGYPIPRFKPKCQNLKLGTPSDNGEVPKQE